jgi:hypothetical protein
MRGQMGFNVGRSPADLRWIAENQVREWTNRTPGELSCEQLW